MKDGEGQNADHLDYVKSALDYLKAAEECQEDFVTRITDELPERVNKDELVTLFQEKGFFRSFTLRLKMTGKKFQEKAAVKAKKAAAIPTASPPSRRSMKQMQQDSDEKYNSGNNQNFDI